MARNEFYRERLDKFQRKRARCACCGESPIHRLVWRCGWFRGDDEIASACITHSELAKRDAREFFRLAELRKQYLDTQIVAQHEETGRMWRGQRRVLPPRYVETNAALLLDGEGSQP